MARIWRDGQQKTCHIYRLLTTGLIDEKMFQRQLYKDNVVGFVGHTKAPASKSKPGSFSRDELKKLFQVNEGTACDTRDMLAASDEQAATAWVDQAPTTTDGPLLAAINAGIVSFVHIQPAAVAEDEECSQSDGRQAGAKAARSEDDGAAVQGRSVRQCWAPDGDAGIADDAPGSQVTGSCDGNGLLALAKTLEDDSEDDWDGCAVVAQADSTHCLQLDSDSES